MKLIITRHGETIENNKKIMQGQLSGTLSELGLKQAKCLANRLKNEKLDFIYSSDLSRASYTAKEIAKHHINTKLKLTKELRERNLGVWQGKTKKELNLLENTSIIKENIPCGETIEELYNRANKFITKIIKKHKSKDNILIIGHYGINQVINFILTDKKNNNNFNIIIPEPRLDNASISIFEINKNKNNKTHLFNCTKHLV